jgi:hypothetical protein
MTPKENALLIQFKAGRKFSILMLAMICAAEKLPANFSNSARSRRYRSCLWSGD